MAANQQRQPDCPAEYGNERGNNPKPKLFISQRPEDHPDAGETDHSKNVIEEWRSLKREEEEHIKEDEERLRKEKERLKKIEGKLEEAEFECKRNKNQ